MLFRGLHKSGSRHASLVRFVENKILRQ